VRGQVRERRLLLQLRDDKPDIRYFFFSRLGIGLFGGHERAMKAHPIAWCANRTKSDVDIARAFVPLTTRRR